MAGGWIMMIVVVALIIAGTIVFIRMASAGTAPSPSAPDTPLDILKRRYAQGELTKEQFEEMKRTVA